MPSPGLMPSPRSVVATEGTARLLWFHPVATPRAGCPLFIVPSLINRWYVLDLRDGSSVVQTLVGRGFDVYVLDWGCPEDEDRYTSWDDVNHRLRRMMRRARRHAGTSRMALLGYCMGGTLAAIRAALEPGRVAGLINLLGPIDFSAGGMLARLVDPSFFDAEAIAAAGNISAPQMQAGFVALRPTVEVARWVRFADRAHRGAARDSFWALQSWAADNIPFPAAAYRTYIQDLYQSNALIAGSHRVGGDRVDLGAIDCPVLTVVADRDRICPAEAATALNDRVSSADTSVLRIVGGHVGAVVGSRARTTLYPALAEWLGRVGRKIRP